MKLNKNSKFVLLLVSFIVIASSFSFIISEKTKELDNNNTPSGTDSRSEDKKVYEKCASIDIYEIPAFTDVTTTYTKENSIYEIEFNQNNNKISTKLLAQGDTPISSYDISDIYDSSGKYLVYTYFEGGPDTEEKIYDLIHQTKEEVWMGAGNVVILKDLLSNKEKTVFSTGVTKDTITFLTLIDNNLYISLSNGDIYLYDIKNSNLTIFFTEYRPHILGKYELRFKVLDESTDGRRLLLNQYGGWSPPDQYVYDSDTNSLTMVSTSFPDIGPVYDKFKDVEEISGYYYEGLTMGSVGVYPKYSIVANQYGSILHKSEVFTYGGYTLKPLFSFDRSNNAIVKCIYDENKNLLDTETIEENVSDLRSLYPNF